MSTRYPFYVPSKGRWDNAKTPDVLDKVGIQYHIIVEEQEYDAYAARWSKKQLLVLPDKYKQDYETCDDLGLTLSTGAGPARNFAWEHSIERGCAAHWVMDDNITRFTHTQNAAKFEEHICGDATVVKVAEDWFDRYSNLAMAGPDYEGFNPTRTHQKPIKFNTRVYSCNLIRNDIPFRWRGRYNEDEILSLDMLSAGWCTALFKFLTVFKPKTQSMHGGNTKEFYNVEDGYGGTYAKTLLLQNVYPDLVKVVMKYGRCHHNVKHEVFRNNRLIKRKDVKPVRKGKYKLQLRPTNAI